MLTVSDTDIARALDKESLYSIVPTELHANLNFRRQIIELGSSSEEAARDIWCACSRDPLWYFSCFAWSFNPKLPDGMKSLPFIPYEFQVKALHEIWETPDDDIVIEKSTRAWHYLACALRR